MTPIPRDEIEKSGIPAPVRQQGDFQDDLLLWFAEHKDAFYQQREAALLISKKLGREVREQQVRQTCIRLWKRDVPLIERAGKKVPTNEGKMMTIVSYGITKAGLEKAKRIDADRKANVRPKA